MTGRIRLQQVQQGSDPSRSPLLFIHGFPDSPLMWSDYLLRLPCAVHAQQAGPHRFDACL